MNPSPLVSIVVPVYNVEKYHRKCLDSLVNQTYRNIEIILVNDGSTDGSVSIMEEFAAKDDRIVILHKENGGQASARNLGVAAATGEWVWNFDSDDIAYPRALEMMVNTAIENNSDIVICGHDLQDEFGNNNKRVTARFDGTISGEQALILMLNYQIGGDPWCRLFRRELYSLYDIKIDDRFSVIDDVILNYRMFSIATCVTAVDYTGLIHLVMRRNSTSTNNQSRNFLRLHHLGAVSMKEYGFISPEVEKAYNGFVFWDFWVVYGRKDKQLLKELGLCSIKALGDKLKLLKNSELTTLRGGGQTYCSATSQSLCCHPLCSGLLAKNQGAAVC